MVCAKSFEYTAKDVDPCFSNYVVVPDKQSRPDSKGFYVYPKHSPEMSYFFRMVPVSKSARFTNVEVNGCKFNVMFLPNTVSRGFPLPAVVMIERFDLRENAPFKKEELSGQNAGAKEQYENLIKYVELPANYPSNLPKAFSEIQVTKVAMQNAEKELKKFEASGGKNAAHLEKLTDEVLFAKETHNRTVEDTKELERFAREVAANCGGVPALKDVIANIKTELTRKSNGLSPAARR